MKAADIMVSKVITVGPNAHVEEVAKILLANRISAVPVVNEMGELVGIISEGDLIHRAEAGTERRRSWWREYLTANQRLAEDYVKSHSRTVADVMTRHVITAAPDTPLEEIANCLKSIASSVFPLCKVERSSESSAGQICCKRWYARRRRAHPLRAPVTRTFAGM